jgi:glycine cleavage system H protein
VIEGIKFTKEHEWVLTAEEERGAGGAGGALATVGISDFAQDQLGDIVSIELPKVGSKFRRTQALGIIDSVKASSDVYCPLSGEVVQVNEELIEHPELINQSPYEFGWIVKLKPSNLVEEVKELMETEKYNEFIGEILKTKSEEKKREEEGRR